MKEAVRIVVVRHPEKDGDRITPHGAEQAFAAALALGELDKRSGLPSFERLLYSGLHRTWQASQVMAAALGLKIPAEEQPFLNFAETVAATVRNSAGFSAELEAMRAAEKTDQLTVTMALRHSEYARRGREIMTAGLITLAVDMERQGQTMALAVSHSPWLELAAPAVFEKMPYGINEADAAIYIVEDGRISSMGPLIKAPLPGKLPF
jgi:phosphohistidine phosphatase SixA